MQLSDALILWYCSTQTAAHCALYPLRTNKILARNAFLSHGSLLPVDLPVIWIQRIDDVRTPDKLVRNSWSHSALCTAPNMHFLACKHRTCCQCRPPCAVSKAVRCSRSYRNSCNECSSVSLRNCISSRWSWILWSREACSSIRASWTFCSTTTLWACRRRTLSANVSVVCSCEEHSDRGVVVQLLPGSQAESVCGVPAFTTVTASLLSSDWRKSSE